MSATLATYSAVNLLYPKPVPPCSRIEAGRAARRLMKHFAQCDSRWLRRCWITPEPTANLDRGWPRLVHDIAHRVFILKNRGIARHHGGWHAELELEIAQYVLAHGWLDGKLKPPATAAMPLDQRRARRLAHAQTMLATWERRAKIAQGRIRRWRGRVKDAKRYIALGIP